MEAAIAADPSNALPVIGRGIAYFGTGDFDRAIADFDHANRLQPTIGDALYWRGLAKLRNGDKSDAEADIAAAKQLNPELGR